jgi:hypothetical protein
MTSYRRGDPKIRRGTAAVLEAPAWCTRRPPLRDPARRGQSSNIPRAPVLFSSGLVSPVASRTVARRLRPPWTPASRGSHARKQVIIPPRVVRVRSSLPLGLGPRAKRFRERRQVGGGAARAGAGAGPVHGGRRCLFWWRRLAVRVEGRGSPRRKGEAYGVHTSASTTSVSGQNARPRWTTTGLASCKRERRGGQERERAKGKNTRGE